MIWQIIWKRIVSCELRARRACRRTRDELAEVLSRFGLYPLLRELCMTTLNDIRERDDVAASALHQLGNIACLQGDYAEAQRLYGQSLAIKERLGDQGGRARTCTS